MWGETLTRNTLKNTKRSYFENHKVIITYRIVLLLLQKKGVWTRHRKLWTRVIRINNFIPTLKLSKLGPSPFLSYLAPRTIVSINEALSHSLEMLTAFSNGKIASRWSTFVIMVPGSHLLILRHVPFLEQSYPLNQVTEKQTPMLKKIPQNVGKGILAFCSPSYIICANKGPSPQVSMSLWIPRYNIKLRFYMYF